MSKSEKSIIMEFYITYGLREVTREKVLALFGEKNHRALAVISSNKFTDIKPVDKNNIVPGPLSHIESLNLKENFKEIFETADKL